MVQHNQQNDHIVAHSALDQLKLSIANSIGLGSQVGISPVTDANYTDVIERHKDQVADSLGILPKVQQAGWENISSRECGKIGGRIGGRLGGQMVRDMITRAETILAGSQ